MPSASRPAGLIRSRTPRLSSRLRQDGPERRRVGGARGRPIVDPLFNEARGRAARRQPCSRHRRAATRAAAAGCRRCAARPRQQDRLGIGKLGHRVLQVPAGPGPFRTAPHPQPRVPGGASAEPWLRLPRDAHSRGTEVKRADHLLAPCDHCGTPKTPHYRFRASSSRNGASARTGGRNIGRGKRDFRVRRRLHSIGECRIEKAEGQVDGIKSGPP